MDQAQQQAGHNAHEHTYSSESYVCGVASCQDVADGPRQDGGTAALESSTLCGGGRRGHQEGEEEAHYLSPWTPLGLTNRAFCCMTHGFYMIRAW